MADQELNTAPTCEKVYELTRDQACLLKMVAAAIGDLQQEATDINPDAAEILKACRSALRGISQRERQELPLGDIMRMRLGVSNGR